MNTTIKAALSAVAISLTLANGTVAADTITLRADEWCPYNCTPGDAKPGYMIEIAQRVFEKAGHTVDYQVLNWARAIEDTRAGKFNGIVGAAHGDAEDFVFPAEELGQSASGFVIKADDNWTYDGVASLESRVLGSIRDYAYNDEIDAYIEANKDNDKKVQVASGDNALEINFRKLQKGRIDTVIDGLAVLSYNVREMGMEGSVRVVADTSPDPVFIAFSPSNPKSAEYAVMLAKGVQALRASGELSKILATYGLKDWK